MHSKLPCAPGVKFPRGMFWRKESFENESLMRKFASLFAALTVLLAANAGRGQNFWEPASGIPPGTANAVAETKYGTIISAMTPDYPVQSPIFTTSNDGITWFEAQTEPLDGLIKIVRSPTGVFFAGSTWGIYRSTDSGMNWTSIRPTNRQSGSRMLAVDSAGNLLIEDYHGSVIRERFYTYYFDTTGISISTDEGQSWNFVPIVAYQSVNTGATSFVGAISLDRKGNVFVALEDSGIFESKDERNWSLIPAPNLSGVRAIAIDSENGLFVGTYKTGLYKLNSSHAWTRLHVALADSSITSIDFDSKNNLFVLSLGQVFRSSDYGSTWSCVLPGPKYNYTSSLCVDPSNNRTLAGTGLGIQFSSDAGNSWRVITHAITMGTNKILVTPDGTTLACSEFGGALYRSRDLGRSWDALPIDRSSWFKGPVLAGHFLFALSSSRGMLRSSDEGSTWNEMNNGLPPADSSGFYEYWGPYSDGEGDVFVYNGNWSQLFVTTDSGSSWHSSSVEPPDLVVFVSDRKGLIYAGGNGLYKSSDRGSTWQRSSDGLFDSTVYGLAVDSQGLIYASTYHYRIFRSSDGGNSWQFIAQLDTTSTGSSVLLAAPDGKLYLGAEFLVGWVFVSSDKGRTWDTINSGLPPYSVDNFALTSDGYLFLANGFIYRLNQQLLAVHTALQSPESNLIANSPNPFHESTTISFTLPSASYISLNLFDATGREVTRIASGYFSAGAHDVSFTRGNLPAGTYFYRLIANGSEKTKAMVVE